MNTIPTPTPREVPVTFAPITFPLPPPGAARSAAVAEVARAVTAAYYTGCLPTSPASSPRAGGCADLDSHA